VGRKAGDVLGDYVLRERAGGGPASELWKAVHRDDPSRAAAIRFFAGGRDVPPLRVKADVLRGLDHPNIARVEEVELAPEARHLRREWVEGQALDRDLPASAAEQVLRALAFAHARGVVHGRLVAADVLLAVDGRVKVSDFGLAGSSADPKADLRAVGELMAAGDPWGLRLRAGEFATAEAALAAKPDVAPSPRMPSWIAGPILIVGTFLIAYVGVGVTFAGLQPSLKLIAGAAGAGLCAVAWRHVERPLLAAVFWGALLWGVGARVEGLQFTGGAWAVAAVAALLWLKGSKPAA
jgi:hypothetical protein